MKWIVFRGLFYLMVQIDIFWLGLVLYGGHKQDQSKYVENVGVCLVVYGQHF